MVIRTARESDLEQIREIFIEVYGHDYPYTEFYQLDWLKKAVYDEATCFMVMELDNRIVATASMLHTVGGLDDMIGEAGRLVATTDPQYRGKNLFQDLIQTLVEETSHRLQFLMAEARTTHRGSQRIATRLGWRPIGFEPLKYCVGKNRESMVLYARLFDVARQLRKNNPRVIPEVATLAQTALHALELPQDAIVEDDTEGYPTSQAYSLKHFKDQQGLTSLLRIERGRVLHREVFGNFSLSHSFFRISNTNTDYLVASEGSAILGAVGFSYDPIDRKIRIIELIEFDDKVKGFLLAAVDRCACQEYDAVYVEVDISAHSPRMQRTLERLGFFPAAYCPAMVFDRVERIDVVRMVKLNAAYQTGLVQVLDESMPILTIVEKTMEDRLTGIEITNLTTKTELFKDIPAGDLLLLSRLSSYQTVAPETVICRENEPADKIFIVMEGSVRVCQNDRTLAILKTGAVFGEMGLVDDTVRAASVISHEPCKLIVIGIAALKNLMQVRPRLGYAVAINLARSLSTKLRTASREHLEN